MTAAGVLDQDDLDEFPALDDIEPEEKPKRRTRQPRDPNAPKVTRQSSDVKLAAELLEPLAMLGQAISFISPTGGAVIMARGEVTTAALVKFAKGHPKMRAALANISKVSPAAELVQTVAMVLIAVQIDFGKLEPNAPFAVLTGVTSIHTEMSGYMAEQEPGTIAPDQVGGQFENIKPPPMFHAEGFNADGTWQAPPNFRAGAGSAVRNP
jgi:hypothetical protein